MAFLYVLGPEGTDAHRAALWWCEKEKFKCALCLLDDYNRDFSFIDVNDKILIPFGYSSRKNPGFLSWVDFHFFHYDILKLVDNFLLATKSMILLQNTQCQLNNAVIHASTQSFLANNVISQTRIHYVNSKVEALREFLNGNYQYSIVSKDLYEKCLKTEAVNLWIQVKKEFTPDMVWGVYERCLPKELVISEAVVAPQGPVRA